MKYCPVEAYRYPDSVTHCKACGALLVKGEAGEGFAGPGGPVFHTLCCPKPGCPTVVAPPQAKFCDQCGGGLAPISLDAWTGKFLAPELEANPFEFIRDPSGALRRAGEMGLSREAVELRLEQRLTEKIGVSPATFREWMREAAKLLLTGADDLDAARRRALQEASARGISAAFAAPVVGRLAAKVEAQRQSAEGSKPPSKPAQPDDSRAAKGGAAKGAKEAGDGNASRGIAAASPVVDGTTAQPGGRVDVRDRKTTRADVVTVPVVKAEDEGGGWEARARKAGVIFAVGFILLVAGVLLYNFVRGRQVVPTDAGTNANANEGRAPGESPTSGQGNVPEAGSANSNTAPSVEASPEASPSANDNAAAEQAEVATVMLLPNVDDVQLWIDNVSGGVVSRARPRSVSLSPGQHVIRATKPNYEVWERPLTLASKQRLTISVSLEEMRGGPVADGAPPAPPTTTPREVARAHAENAQRLFDGGSVDDALAEVNEGLRASGDDRTLLSLKQRLERAKSVLQTRSTVPADTLGPSQRRSDQQESRADRSAQLVRMPSPVYPPASISKGSTTVWVEVQVDERGGVSSARAIRGPSSFHSAAVSAARQAVFRPALRNGQAAGDRVTLAVMFNPL